MNRVVVAAFVLAVSSTAAWAQPGTEAQAPTALAQFQSGGTTTLAPDGTALSTTAVFSAVMHGTDSTPATPEHKIRVEVRPMGTAFIDVFTDEASTTVVSFEANGGDALAAISSVTVTGLVPGQQYHWQAMTFKT